ncbi:MAG: hypothetical protein K1X67_12000 [Fimbriimonadaceae bacterium]|nr:hypothetical protein [Fimbriimonadaceae bacterium]
MANIWTHEKPGLSGAFRRLRIRNLKSCPVCTALNSKQNHQCFVCGWSGRFDDDPESIERGLSDLIDRCPEIAEILIEGHSRPPSLFNRVRVWFRRFGRKVDVTV